MSATTPPLPGPGAEAGQLTAGQREMMAFLRARASSGGLFQADDILSACPSLKRSSLRTYLSKGQLAPLLASREPPYRVRPEVAGLSDAALRRSMSQSKRIQEGTSLDPLARQLLARSQTNAALALELINRPGLANRLDAFVLLMLTAWEQLLKAQMHLREPGSVFTGGVTATGRKITIAFSKALERVFPLPADPVRRNLELLKELRDGCAHLVVPELTGIATRYFQSSLLNYMRHFQEVAGEPALRFEGTGLLTLGVAYQSPAIEALRVAHGAEAEEVRALIEALESGAVDADDPRFAVSIRHELILDKKPGAGAIHLSAGDAGPIVAVVKVPREASQLCPHLTADCARILTDRTGVAWNSDAVAKVADFLRVKRDNNEYHYGYKHGTNTYHRYSDTFINLVCQRLASTPRLIADARDASRNAGRTRV